MSNLKSGNFPLLTYRSLSVLATGQVIKAFSGDVLSMYISNNGAAVNYLKFYDKATAPTASDTPILTLPIPLKSVAPWSPLDGIHFTAGISIRASTGVADSDNTAPGANEVVVNIEYL